MAIESIPASYKYQCDRCRMTHLQKNANGHYLESTPPGWRTLKMLEGVRMDRDDSTSPSRWELLLCEPCGGAIEKFLRDFVPPEPAITDKAVGE